MECPLTKTCLAEVTWDTPGGIYVDDDVLGFWSKDNGDENICCGPNGPNSLLTIPNSGYSGDYRILTLWGANGWDSNGNNGAGTYTDATMGMDLRLMLPEPGTLTLFVLGLSLFGFGLRVRRVKAPS